MEAIKENMRVDLSQGSHFLQYLISLGEYYFSIGGTDGFQIDWDWLTKQEVVEETQFIRHVKLPSPLLVKVDGRSGRGVIYKSLGTDHE